MRAALMTAALLMPAVGLAQAPETSEETGATTGPTTYELSASDGRLYVLVRYKRCTLASGLAHDHVVVAGDWTGSVTWDPANVSACDVRFDLPVSGLVVDPGSARDWEGLEGTTSADDKESIRENMRSDDQLDMQDHPRITYRSTRCVAGSGGKTNVTGTMTIHGVSHELTVPMTIRAEGGSFNASGEFTATHADFGMDPYSKAFGAVKNDEQLKFVIDVSG